MFRDQVELIRAAPQTRAFEENNIKSALISSFENKNVFYGERRIKVNFLFEMHAMCLSLSIRSIFTQKASSTLQDYSRPIAALQLPLRVGEVIHIDFEMRVEPL